MSPSFMLHSVKPPLNLHLQDKPKPTIIRPSQPAKAAGSSTLSPPKPSTVPGVAPGAAPGVATGAVQTQKGGREPPKTLNVKKDPWNQIPKVSCVTTYGAMVLRHMGLWRYDIWGYGVTSFRAME